LIAATFARSFKRAIQAAQIDMPVALAASRPRLADERTAASRTGLSLLVSALLLCPFVGLAFGRPWTQAEVFGLAPDPTALATLGALLLLAPARPGLTWRLAWLLPLLWCALSGMTHWVMQAR
jgi:hypothetical protein